MKARWMAKSLVLWHVWPCDMRFLKIHLGAVLLILFPWLAQPLARGQSNTPAAGARGVAAGVRPLKSAGIDNFYQLSARVYSGAAPEGDEAFAALKNLGIKTIITVDGAKPEVETARRFGLQYAHLPIGYDGVPASQALRLVKAAETLPGPIFVHCHHGLHRGPAGAAVICLATEGWTPEEAEAWLKLAGTATNYGGLYQSVRLFHPPTAEVLRKVSSDFPEKSEVSPLADVMIQIDERFDHLKLVKKAGYRSPASHPDLDPEQESLLLEELFKELLRSPAIEKRPLGLRSKLSEIARAAAALRSALGASASDPKIADAAFEQITEACASCHKTYRN
jgi:protein tyrosine phosphatase (PTP) superfamily phosphohydrolase (DUF442 family)